MLYAKSTGGFYTPEIHGTDIPPDVVEISEQEYADLLEGQANGYQIASDQGGRPILTLPPPPSPAQIQAQFVEAIQFRLDDCAWI